ncbi:MAG: DUF354 domain-containing protein [Bacteroidetes bacterium]|nr:DUF354 domain-containing protein [Bacteroidota bacterium]
MRILIDIGHPAHVHLFRNSYFELSKRGHNVQVLIRQIPIIEKLLSYYNIPYKSLGRKGNSFLAKGLKTISQDLKVLQIVRKEKIDIGISSGIVLSQVAKLSKMQTLIFDDDDDNVEPLVVNYGHPFANFVITPSPIKRKVKNNISYQGTHELSYLHPNRFIPDPSVISRLNLQINDIFFVLRFVAFKGHHDNGHFGVNLAQKISLINLLKPYGKVFITSENPIESELEEYRIPVPPQEIHSLLYYATLFLGDSQTMTSEAAILGTPALKCNTFSGKLSVPNELEEKYGLCYSYHPSEFESFYKKTKDLLETPNLKVIWLEKKLKFLDDKIDVTAFMVWFIENYPESAKIMKENPDYQYNF